MTRKTQVLEEMYLVMIVMRFDKNKEDLPEIEYELDHVDDPCGVEGKTEKEQSSNLETEEHYGRDGSVIRKRKKAKVFYSVGYSRISDP